MLARNTATIRASKEWFAEVDAWALSRGLSRNAAIIALCDLGLVLLMPKSMDALDASIEALKGGGK